jgi:hypothetical protein
MGCIITDKALVLDAGGTASAVVGATITARPTLLPIYELVAGEMREIASPTRTDTTDSNGEWSFTLPWPSESDPTTVEWAIFTQDGYALVGAVPEGESGPLTLWDLKNDHDWALASNTSDIPIAIQGEPGYGLIPTVTKTSAHSAAVGELVVCDPSSGAFTVTGPANTDEGEIFAVVNDSDSTNLVTVDPSGTETVAGQASIALGPRDSAVFVKGTGSNWMVI